MHKYLFKKKILPVFCILFFSLLNTYANTGYKDSVVKVGIKQVPPFAIKDEKGEWKGISVSLWKSIAQNLNIHYEFKEQNLTKLINNLEKNKLDASIGAITITAKREERVDFSHPYFVTGLE